MPADPALMANVARVKVAAAVALLSLVAVPSLAVAAPPEASVGAALQRLEKARADLASAVQRIEKDPPEMADLEAARVAVDALKEAIDAGAEFEGKDLDFAKSSLAARKELRTQREYVDQRRANVDIFNQRRVIDAAIAALADRAKKVTDGKEAPAKDYDDARAAAQALKASLEQGRAFAKRDPKFAAFLTETDASLAKQSKAIDERWIAQTLDQHRAQLTEARKALTAAVAQLTPQAPDPQFEAADKAASALAKLLDDGKTLERDKGYRAEAEAVRKEWAAAKKKIDTTFSETGLARLKAEIEPAHLDLITAAKALRGKKPPPEAVAEARTAAIVVRKLVEKHEAASARSEALGQYVAKVKATLSGVELTLDKGSLSAAQATVAQAMKPIGGKEPTDEQFEEAAAAVAALEKVVEAAREEDPAIAPLVTEAKAVVQASQTTLAARRTEVDVQRQKAKVEEARQVAAGLNKPPIPADRLDEAEAAINQIKAALQAGTALIERDKGYAFYAGEVELRVAELAAKLAARRTEVAVSEQKAKVEDARKVAAGLNKPPIPGDRLDEAEASINQISAALEGGKALIDRDKGYAFYAGEVQLRVAELATKLAARRIEVAVLNQKAKVEEARKTAAELNKPDIPADRMAEAETSINQIKAALEAGTELIAKDKDYAYYHREVQKRVDELFTKLAARKIAIAAADGRAALTEAVTAATARLATAKAPEVTDAELAAAAQSLAAITKELDARTALEPKSPGYAAQAVKTRDALARMTEALAFAKQVRELRKQTVEALATGIAAAEAAPTAKTLRGQKDLYDKAIAQFRTCEQAGVRMPQETPGLERITWMVDGKKTAAKDLVTQCLQRIETADAALVVLKPLITFDEGPKKSYETGKALLAQNKSADALKHFNECISSTATLKQRNPHLEARTFVVAGKDITLADLIKECAAQSKTLREKK